MTNQAWKNKLVWGTAVALVFSSVVGVAAAGAASDKANGKAETKVEAKAETAVQAKDDITVTATAEDETTVTDAVYNNGNTHGLLNAIKNLEGKPARAKVEALLELRGVSAEEIAAALEAQGDLEAAVVAQEEAAAGEPTDVDAVKKLAKLLNKSGQIGVKAFVNGKQTKFDVQPFIKEGRTLVPFRAIAASLKAEVSYDAAAKTVTVVRGDVTVKLTLGSDVALVNGKEVKLDVPAQAVKGRTVIPMRFLSEALGAKVSFDKETQSVIVTE
ncbi:copper amine oxidase N-terminal domain-containing protein [Paenibacillus thermotolerans]|uniref:copper amine oxidase N-terminal domain-containing protein n=1 Tax=Paenibacillus thermotolerans TaxID=3027807 RepID=UPI002368BFF6|nr:MULTISPECIES: copper amine oxidase N-terminal domain-containing protein [unclassified Paenibacillus]